MILLLSYMYLYLSICKSITLWYETCVKIVWQFLMCNYIQFVEQTTREIISERKRYNPWYFLFGICIYVMVLCDARNSFRPITFSNSLPWVHQCFIHVYGCVMWKQKNYTIGCSVWNNSIISAFWICIRNNVRYISCSLCKHERRQIHENEIDFWEFWLCLHFFIILVSCYIRQSAHCTLISHVKFIDLCICTNKRHLEVDNLHCDDHESCSW